ncbi:hypothetical protein [Streptomyces sp. NPDC088789]|uniref:hypothetical protein n=1 Tax=Streptomyces sp. NPDC088789 TaxID=3365899 RepID=UPI0038008EDF
MTTPPPIRLISSATLWHLHIAQGRKEALCAWLRANGIDPVRVPQEYDLTVEDTPDGRVIRHHVFATNDDDVKVEPQDGGPRIHERVVPLLVEPSADWPVYALTDSKEQT